MRNRRCEYQSLTFCIAFIHFGNAIVRKFGVDRFVEFADVKIAQSFVYVAYVVTDIYAQTFYVCEPAVFYAPTQIALKKNFIENVVEPNFIAAVWRCGKAYFQPRMEV